MQWQLPNYHHSFTYSLNPVVVGHLLNIHVIVGKSTATVEKSVIMDISGYFPHNNTLAFQNKLDYCKLFVEPSGSVCSMEKGHDYIANWLVPISKQT